MSTLTQKRCYEYIMYIFEKAEKMHDELKVFRLRHKLTDVPLPKFLISCGACTVADIYDDCFRIINYMMLHLNDYFKTDVVNKIKPSLIARRKQMYDNYAKLMFRHDIDAELMDQYPKYNNSIPKKVKIQMELKSFDDYYKN